MVNLFHPQSFYLEILILMVPRLKAAGDWVGLVKIYTQRWSLFLIALDERVYIQVY
jgi:hypothetical protein